MFRVLGIYNFGYTTAKKWKFDFFSITKPGRDNLKPRFLIKSGYYIVPSPSTALRGRHHKMRNYETSSSVHRLVSHRHGVLLMSNRLLLKFEFHFSHQSRFHISYQNSKISWRKMPISYILSKSFFEVKNQPNLSKFSFLWRILN